MPTPARQGRSRRGVVLPREPATTPYVGMPAPSGAVDEGGDVRRAAAGRVVPARRRGVGAYRAERDVVERGRGHGRVDHRPGEPERAALRTLRAGPDALPRRRTRAGAADDLLGAVDDHAVAGERVGVERDLGHATVDPRERAA